MAVKMKRPLCEQYMLFEQTLSELAQRYGSVCVNKQNATLTCPRKYPCLGWGILKQFISVHPIRDKILISFFLQVGFGDGPCLFYSIAMEGGGEDPSTSWSWIRFSVDDIIFWASALPCSIVLPLDKGELWQGHSQSTNNISLEQRMPPLKFSFGPTTQGDWDIRVPFKDFLDDA